MVPASEKLHEFGRDAGASVQQLLLELQPLRRPLRTLQQVVFPRLRWPAAREAAVGALGGLRELQLVEAASQSRTVESELCGSGHRLPFAEIVVAARREGRRDLAETVHHRACDSRVRFLVVDLRVELHRGVEVVGAEV